MAQGGDEKKPSFFEGLARYMAENTDAAATEEQSSVAGVDSQEKADHLREAQEARPVEPPQVERSSDSGSSSTSVERSSDSGSSSTSDETASSTETARGPDPLASLIRGASRVFNRLLGREDRQAYEAAVDPQPGEQATPEPNTQTDTPAPPRITPTISGVTKEIVETVNTAARGAAQAVQERRAGSQRTDDNYDGPSRDALGEKSKAQNVQANVQAVELDVEMKRRQDFEEMARAAGMMDVVAVSERYSEMNIGLTEKEFQALKEVIDHHTRGDSGSQYMPFRADLEDEVSRAFKEGEETAKDKDEATARRAGAYIHRGMGTMYSMFSPPAIGDAGEDTSPHSETAAALGRQEAERLRSERSDPAQTSTTPAAPTAKDGDGEEDKKAGTKPPGMP